MSDEAERSRIPRRLFPWLGLALMLVSLAVFELERGRYLPPLQSRTMRVVHPEAFSTVVLDAGHGGEDSGALVDGMSEKELTLDLTKRIERHLQLQGLRTVLTRDGDNFVSLAGRAEAANQEKDCIFVSIHFNETGKRSAATGVETYYAQRQVDERSGLASWLPFLQHAALEAPNLESESLAGFIQEALVSRTQATNRGVKAEQFYVLANVRHPAVLVEGGFLSNKTEADQLRSEAYREGMATAISEGISKFREVVREANATVATGVPGG